MELLPVAVSYLLKIAQPFLRKKITKETLCQLNVIDGRHFSIQTLCTREVHFKMKKATYYKEKKVDTSCKICPFRSQSC